MARHRNDAPAPHGSDRAAVVRAALRALAPGDAEARLRWLLELSERDRESPSETQWTQRQIQMAFIVSRTSWAHRDRFNPPLDAFPVSTAQRHGFTRLQERLRALFVALVEDGRHEVHLPRRGAGHWVISRRRNAKGQLEAEAHFLGHAWLQLVLLAVRLLDQVGAHRLRGCLTPGCKRLFLARRRQRFCSLAHSRKAAWDAWLQRHGGTRAKGGLRGNVPTNVPASTRKQPQTTPPQPTRERKTPR